MICRIRLRTLWVCLCSVALAAGLPASALACSACFGASDSDLAKGMNMGIFALLGVVVVVLGGIATFFVYLIRRANALERGVTQEGGAAAHAGAALEPEFSKQTS